MSFADSLTWCSHLAILEGRAVFMAACDISAPQLLMRLRAGHSNDNAGKLSLELLHACHIEFAHLQDVTLSAM